MKPAPFRLGKVLRIRELELDRACVALAAAEGELLSARRAVELCTERARNSESELARRMQGGVSAGELRVAARGIEGSKLALHAAKDRERACGARVVEARDAVLASRTRVRALEKLRARRNEAMRRYLEKMQQNELDEIAVRGAGDPGEQYAG